MTRGMTCAFSLLRKCGNQSIAAQQATLTLHDDSVSPPNIVKYGQPRHQLRDKDESFDRTSCRFRLLDNEGGARVNLKSNRYVHRELGVGCFVLQSQSSTSHTPKSRVISCLTFSMTVLCRPSMMKSTNGLAPFRHVSSSRQKTIPQKQRDANCNLALHCRMFWAR